MLDKYPLPGWRENPIKRENPQEPRFRCFACPPAPRAFTGNIFLAENFHRVIFRERWLGTFSLEIDIVPTLGACKNDSVCVTHTSRITPNAIFGQFAASLMQIRPFCELFGGFAGMQQGERLSQASRLHSKQGLFSCSVLFLESIPAVFHGEAAVRLSGQLNVIHGPFIRDPGLGRSARSLIGYEFLRHVVVAGAFGKV
jgi:hypothetical protein